jgi:phosphoribosylformimino-5-aminoimidazole carboxamide ribotide isomerase
MKWFSKYGNEKVILGADARNRKIATDGWHGSTQIDVIEFIRHYAHQGITEVICTDIEVDGTLAGPSVKLYIDIMKDVPGIQLIASGGVRDLSHIEQLAEIGVAGVIVGKAIYEGTLDLQKALAIC